MKPKLLDLCCKAGGMSMGYHQAGFDVTGVDIEPQPHYPFKFIQADALTLDAEFLREFDLISASPPCQKYTKLAEWVRKNGKAYPNLINLIRDMLRESKKSYVIENVEEAPLIDPVILCGSMFNLRVRRHRKFESNFRITQPDCRHEWQDNDKIFDRYDHGKWYKSGIVGVYGCGGKDKARSNWEKEMGINWMNSKELAQAIPPAYSKYIGEQFLERSLT